MARTKKTSDESEEPEPLAEEEPELLAYAVVEPQRVAVTHQARYNHQLVVDLDFSVNNPITVIHSLHSDMLYVSAISLGNPPAIPPAFSFDDLDQMTVTATPSLGSFRIYIGVVPL